ncbi:MAG: rubrerythrin family protein [Anaerolineae bacterium]|nr:rubrerythrin family protein [Anaerolineae bacterium]
MRPMTEGNLKAAFAGESQAHMRYLAFADKAEKIHADMYKSAKAEADAGRDVAIGKVYICPVCGYTVEGDTPDKCPVCGAQRKLFKEF